MSTLEEIEKCAIGEKEMVSFLWSKWIDAVTNLGMDYTAEMFDQIIIAYSDKRRCYHGLIHLFECVRELNKHRYNVNHIDEMIIALFFHDMVYDTHVKDELNVKSSVELWESFAGSHNLDSNKIKFISEIIFATKHDADAITTESEIVSDVDLAMIIKFMPETIEHLVRCEYSWVPEKEYHIARKDILKRLYLRDHIFQSKLYSSDEEKMKCSLLKMIQLNEAHVAVGGTFDLFHKGHQKLIKESFLVAGGNLKESKITIGITTDRVALNKSHPVQPFEIRKRQLVNFIKKNKYNSSFEVAPLENPEGDLLIDRDYDILVVSKETECGGLIIKNKRSEMGLPPIILDVIDLITDGNGRISSTRLRSEDH